jgi:hypothetical protein
LVVYSCEQRRIEATFKGDQDSYRVIEPMMMMMMTVHPIKVDRCCHRK